MTGTTVDLLILGLGNVLCGDDGAGVAAVERLRARWDAPDGVRILDGGTLGLSLLPWLCESQRVLLVDAVAADAPAGTIIRLEGEAVTVAAEHRLSVHQIGVADLLEGARLLGGNPARVVLVGVVPASIELGLERTPEVERHLDDLVEAAAAEAAALGFPLTRRPPETGAPLPADRAPRSKGWRAGA